MVLEILDPGHELGVAERESEPPTRHAVRLRHREELDPRFAGALGREEARGSAAVEDEVAVGEVVEHPRARALRPVDRFRIDALGHTRGHRVGRVVQVERRGVVRRRRPVGPSVRLERQPGESRTGERDGGEIVGIAGIGKHDRVAALDADLR